MQDIIPPKKRKSIRDIPLPEGKNHFTHERSTPSSETLENNFKVREREVRHFPAVEEEYIEEQKQEDDFEEEYVEESVPRRSKNRTKPSGVKILSYSVLLLLLAITVFYVSREGAKVFVYAKELTQTTNISIELPFTPVESTLEKSISLKATGEEKVTEKSKGKITIYNEYEETEQRLLKDTRFESPGGLIYRIPTSVVVPGLKRDEKGNVVPGKLEVDILADKAGENYNIGAAKFTVPGFKDLPQYESFYAISTNSTEGGFDGVRKVISDSDRQEAESSLKNQLQEELIVDVKNKSNEQTVVLANESMILYEILGDKVDGNNVSISARGKINAMSFDLQEFSNFVAKSAVPMFSDNENVIIKNIDDLKISASKKDTDNIASLDVSGSIEFLWKNDSDTLKSTIAGTDKESLKETVDSFPGITKISSEVKPFWKKTFPEDTSKIKIIDSKN